MALIYTTLVLVMLHLVYTRVHHQVVRIKAHQVVCSRLVHWCALVCEMDVDNLRMREEVSTHHYAHFPAHQRQLVRCGKVKDFVAQNVLWNLNTMFSYLHLSDILP